MLVVVDDVDEVVPVDVVIVVVQEVVTSTLLLELSVSALPCEQLATASKTDVNANALAPPLRRLRIFEALYFIFKSPLPFYGKNVFCDMRDISHHVYIEKRANHTIYTLQRYYSKPISIYRQESQFLFLDIF